MEQVSSVEFYNADSENLALSSLEEFWPHAHRFGKMGENNLRPDIRDTGQESPMLWQGDAETGFLGVRPILWALLILNRFDNDKKVTIQSQRPMLEDSILQGVDPDPDGTAVPADSEIVDCLRQMIRKGNVNTYVKGKDAFYFVFFAGKIMKTWYKRTSTPCPSDKQLLEKAGDAWFMLTKNVRPQNVADAFVVLRGLLPANAHYTPVAKQGKLTQDFSRGKHLISDGIWAYVGGEYVDKVNPPKPRDKAKSIIKRLSAERAVLLHGPVNAGKSSVIVELLREMAQEASGNTINLSVPGIDLPVCVINARVHSDREVALRVLAFLEFMDPKHNRNELNRVLEALQQEFRGSDRINDLERLYERLGEACKARPGFFIFTNWDEQGDSSPRSMMRDQSKAGLIRLLHDSHSKTRILLSTLGADDSPGKRLRSTLPSMKKIKIQDPVFSQITRYWPELTVKDDAERDVISQLESLIGVQKQIPGAHLMLIAVLIQLTAQSKGPIRSRAALALLFPTLKAYVTAVNQGKKNRARLQKAVRPLVRTLLVELNRQNMLRIVLAIASSDDGLRPKSLKNVLSDWVAQSGRPLARKTPLEDLEALLIGLGSGFFVMKTPSADPNTSQLDFGEIADPRDEQYELNQTLREMIFAEIFLEENNGLRLEEGEPSCLQLCREAQRHVATRSRQRARNWRLNTRMARLTRNWRDYLPDIQTYESLLSSLDPTAFSEATRCSEIVPNQALVHRELEVFRQSDVYDHRLALRFAVNCILRNEIDRNGQLSMLYDQDSLRKKLCLLPFLKLGQKHFVEASELGRVAKLPDELPLHVRESFLPTEIVDMLTSVALAAFHSQCLATLNWANARFVDLLRAAPRGDRKKLLNRGVRILCSVFDASIVCGGPIWFKAGIDSNHGDTLSQLYAFLRPEGDKLVDFGDINFLFGNSLDPDFGLETIANGMKVVRLCLEHDWGSEEQSLLEFDIDTLFAWLRLKVREATLLDCLGHKDTALMIYDAVHRVEALVGDLRADTRSLVLNGRLARQEVLALLTSPSFRSQGRGDVGKGYEATEQRIRSLLSANSSRLSRFGGAEQAATLMMLAQFEALRRDGDLVYAELLARKSLNSVENDQASLGMYSQILAVQIQINLQVLERDAKKLSSSRLEPRAKKLLKDTELLVRIANDGLGHRPMAARAFAFKGQIMKVMIKYLKDQVAVFEAQEALQEAIRLQNSCQHTFHDLDVQGMLGGLYST